MGEFEGSFIASTPGTFGAYPPKSLPIHDLYPGDIVTRGDVTGVFGGFIGVGKHGDELILIDRQATYYQGCVRVLDSPERLRKRLQALIVHRRPAVVIPWLP